MIRIFLPSEQLASEQISITGDQAKHLNVLRVQRGDTIIVFDGQGYKYACSVVRAHKKEVIVERRGKEPSSAESPVSCTLAQGIAKGAKMDLIIQKATELGVNKIIPIITERSQVRHTEKTGRWQKIALAASQQSGRDMVPAIDVPVTLENFLAQQIPPSARNYKEDIKGVTSDSHGSIIFSENTIKRGFKNILKSMKDVKNITLLVGPEGGFTEQEVEAAVDKGCVEASLGPRILRTETASITVLSIIQYELGDLGK